MSRSRSTIAELQTENRRLNQELAVAGAGWRGEAGASARAERLMQINQSLQRGIQERNRIEEALRESERRYSRIVNTTSEGIWVVDADMRTSFVNEPMARMLGYEVGEMRRRHIYHFLDEEWREASAANAERRRQGISERYDFCFRRKDGSGMWAIVSAAPIFDVQGNYEGALGMITDITDRKRAEAALQEKHALLTAVVEGTTDSVFVKDRNRRYVMMNTAGARMLAKPVEEVVGSTDDALFSAESARLSAKWDREVLESGRTMTRERVSTAAGVTRTHLVLKAPMRDEAGNVTGIIGIARDITDRKRVATARERLESRLMHAQKMEALGQLAGGVAHDFNNLLTAILGNTEMMMQTLEETPTPHCEAQVSALEQIRRAGDRAASLTRQLLAVSRQQVRNPRVLDPNRVVSDMKLMLQRLIAENVRLETVLAENVAQVYADVGQTEQVLMNLALNGRDAMPQGGVLTLETANVVLGEAELADSENATPGPHVMIAVHDTGIGMSPEIQRRIFEPFFTTKPLGKGTGLGLATVYGIVAQTGGHISFESEPGQGTTFRVYFPAARREASQPVAKDPTRQPGGHETVLVCEDDELVRHLTCRALESSGYKVLSAENGKLAMELAATYGDRIDLLLTDIVMPEMNGCDLATNLIKTRPETRVLYMSGYSPGFVSPRYLPGQDFLAKPVSPGALLRAVRRILDRKPAEEGRSGATLSTPV